jgi:uncharacterized protein YndB with AHSA1/START domain
MKWVFRIVGGLVTLLAIATLVLLALGQRNGAGDIRVSMDINASPERIWPWLDDGEHAKQWVTWLVEVRSDPAAKQKPVGAKEVWVMRDENNGGQKMEITGICTEYTPYSRLSVHLSTPGEFEGDQTYQLTDLGGGRTRLDSTSHFRYAVWFGRLMEPVITPSAQKKMAEDLARMKALVEKN